MESLSVRIQKAITNLRECDTETMCGEPGQECTYNPWHEEIALLEELDELNYDKELAADNQLLQS